MHPICFNIGGFDVHWYGVMAVAAVLVAYKIFCLNRRYAGVSVDQASTIIFFCVLLGGVVGARLFYVAQNFSSFARRPWYAMLNIHEGGLVFYGGFFLATALILLYCRRQKLAIVPVLDIMAPALAVGHGVARIGCFLQGCCYGAPTDFFLAVRYPDAANVYPGSSVHPVQLYEMAVNILLGALLFVLVRRCRRGVAFSAYIFGYGAVRFALEFLRGDAVRGAWGVLSTSQLIGLVLMPVGLALLFYFALKKPAATPDIPAER